MKPLGNKISSFCAIIALTLSLLSCASHPEYYQSQMDHNYTQEKWMRDVNLNPHQWTAGADPWFYKSELDTITHKRVFDPVSQQSALKPIHIPSFTKINITGKNLKIQILGSQQQHSVTVIGPQEIKDKLSIKISNHTLIIQPKYAEKDKNCLIDFSNITIRIGMTTLEDIIAKGENLITGKAIYSRHLNINAIDHSNILLKGNIGISHINTADCSHVTLLGTTSSCAHLCVKDCGVINIAGKLNIKSIINLGNGTINVIGALSHDLCIFSNSKSTTKIAGIANIKQIKAEDYSHIYLYWVNGDTTTVKTTQHAYVALAGRTNSLHVESYDSSVFLGKCLKAKNIYVKTYGLSHANVSSTHRVFASASGDSSIFYFGSPAIISRYISDNGTIIPLWTNEIPNPPVSQLQTGYLDFTTTPPLPQMAQ